MEIPFSLLTLEGEILISIMYVVIYRAKKKYFAQQNLFELYNWILVLAVPATAAIPVLFSIFPQNPHFILAPFWIGLGIWLGIASKAKLNENEKPHRLKILLHMGLILFFIGITAHLLLIYLQSIAYNIIKAS